MNEALIKSLLFHIEEKFIEKYLNLKGLSYLAVVQKEAFKYHLEIGYDRKGGINSEKIKEIKKFILNNCSRKLPKIYENDISESFNYTNDIKYQNDYQSEYFIYNQKNDVCGTLGAVFSTNEKEKKYYIISNHHVLVGNVGVDKVFNTFDEEIGILSWQENSTVKKNIREYDIAIAEITNKKFFPDTFKYKFHHKKIIKTTPSIRNVKTYGGKSGEDKTGKLYATNALVKVGNHWYRNQLLFTFEKIGNGDSGSIITDLNENILGLYHGTSNNLKVANNLYEFFLKPIDISSKNKLILHKFY